MENPKEDKKFDITRLLIWGLLSGVFVGLFFGESVAWMKYVGDIYVALLQMVVLPFVVFSLIANIGKLTLGQARLLATRGLVVLLSLWVIGCLVVLLVAQALPERETGAFFSAGLVEKPEVGAAPSDLAVAARYVFRPVIFQHLAETRPGAGGEIQLTDAIGRLLASGGSGIGMRLPPDEPRYDIGNFESYFRAFVEFALADEKYGDSLRRVLGRLS